MQNDSTDRKKIWTVSELNRSARDLLAEHFPRVWVEGEVSNFKLYPSGHAYFSLKDAEGQLAAAIFRFASRKIQFEVKDGLAVTAAGELTIFDRRGQYQLVADTLEPKGKGALQLAFEQLKERLGQEGLFDPERKRPLPFLPRRVGVVTSSRGAAVRDVINVLRRRFPSISILVSPVRVQGDGAAEEIARAIVELNALGSVDVMIVGRGGGSMEDLWAFNEEAVARAIAASEIPVVSAVGHETDFTIADFVADLRAPTPSAAAELVARSRESLENRAADIAGNLSRAMSRLIEGARHRLESLAVHRMISDQRRRLRDEAQRADDLHQALCRAVREPLKGSRDTFRRLAAQLDALSPLAVMARGYSICRLVPAMTVVRDAADVEPGAEVTIRPLRGELLCRVEEVTETGEDHSVDRGSTV